MPRLQRGGIDNRLIVRNSKVYASTMLNGKMNGLFAYHDVEPGEILVQYTGKVLTQREADESDSDYLFDVHYRSRKGLDVKTTLRKTIDGRGYLGGYANHAPEHLANAFAVDLLPSIIRYGRYYLDRHALVLVAKKRIRQGHEIRFPYDGCDGDGDMVQMMMRRGVAHAQLEDKAWQTVRYLTLPPERSGTVDPDFPYRFVRDVDPDFPRRIFAGGD